MGDVENHLQRAIACTRSFLKKFDQLSGGFKAPTDVVIEFADLGTDAGIAYGHRKIVYNKTLLLENVDDFLANTVPHEVSHVCVDYNFKVKRSHGKEWRTVMQMFGVEPNRTHSYDIANVQRKKSRDMTKHLFTCKCNTQHILSPQKAAQASGLACAKCNGRLKFVERAKESILKQKYKTS